MRKICCAIALLVAQCVSAQAADPNCMNDYYRTKLPACIDSILSEIRDAPSWPISEPTTLIGFLAQLFRAAPDEKQRILASETSEYLREVYLKALHRAGLRADAETFARTHSILARLRSLDFVGAPPLDDVRPSSLPADNDLLIGAYMASGNTVFIERILENFSTADDAMASDGLRIGLMQLKFGPRLVPADREPVTAAAACEKYQCNTNLDRFYRVFTLSTAMWATQALGKNDENVSRTATSIFQRDKRLNDLLTAEQAALGNYVVAVSVLAALKSDHAAAEADRAYAATAKAASSYETLGSARDAFAPIDGLAGSGKKPN